jgi:hypothetical protein
MYIKASGLQADICVCGANKYFNDTKKGIKSKKRVFIPI